MRLCESGMHDASILNMTSVQYRIIPSSELLRGVRCLEIDVSGLHVGPILKGQMSTKRTPECTALGRHL